MVLEYNRDSLSFFPDCCGSGKMNCYDRTKLLADFKETVFLVRGLTVEQLDDTIVRASLLLKPYRGKVAVETLTLHR